MTILGGEGLCVMGFAKGDAGATRHTYKHERELRLED